MLCPNSVFITGCNRGIGLELVKQFLALPSPPKHLIAACRNPDKATELTELTLKHPELKIFKFDAAEPDQFGKIRQEVEGIVGEDGVNLLINNAGMCEDVTNTSQFSDVRKDIEEILEMDGLNLLINNAGVGDDYNSIMDVTEENLLKSFTVNTIAPVLLTKEFLPLLVAAARSSGTCAMGCSRAAVVNLTSIMSSIEYSNGGKYPYRISKAGLNMATESMSLDKNFQNDKILCLMFHPGWVRTDMGGPNAMIDTTQSVQGMFDVMSQAGPEQNGKFYDYAFNPIPW